MCQSGELAWAGQLNFLNKVLLKELYTFHLLLPLYMQGSLNPCQLDLNSNLIQFNLMFKSETFTHHLPLPLSVQGFLSLRFTTFPQNFPTTMLSADHHQHRMWATKRTSSFRKLSRYKQTRKFPAISLHRVCNCMCVVSLCAGCWGLPCLAVHGVGMINWPGRLYGPFYH